MVPVRYSKLVSALGELGMHVDLSTLSSRIILQKRAYFLQAFGLPIGYSFGWYVFGPYSSELTKEAYAGEGLERTVTISSIFNRAIMVYENRFRTFFSQVFELSQSGHGEEYWLELLSSLHYLGTARGASPSREGVFSLLSQLKPNKFEPTDMDRAWGVLNRHRLLN